jgi:5'-deoxynucleotidase
VLRLVKAADKLSALLKCIEEDGSGNADFRSAEKTTRASLEAMAQDLPELRDFMAEFLPAYGSTLDELVGR